MNLSLPERERLAYIYNLPVAKLLAQFCDLDGSQNDEMRHEIDMLKDEVKELQATRQDIDLQEECADLADEVEDQGKKLRQIEILCSDISWE